MPPESEAADFIQALAGILPGSFLLCCGVAVLVHRAKERTRRAEEEGALQRRSLLPKPGGGAGVGPGDEEAEDAELLAALQESVRSHAEEVALRRGGAAEAGGIEMADLGGTTRSSALAAHAGEGLLGLLQPAAAASSSRL